MKKKWFSLIAFAFILTGAMFLTACGEKRCYYTVVAPDHCNVAFNIERTDNQGKTYTLKDEEIVISINVESGYEVVGDLTINYNGTEVEWTSVDSGNYSYSFIPTGDFDIVVSGTISEIHQTVLFEAGEYTNLDDFNSLFIKFPNENEQTLTEFFSSSTATQKTLNYGDSIEFWVYTKEYGNPIPLIDINNYDSFLYKSFYNQDNNFGYYYNMTVYDDAVLTFSTNSMYNNSGFKIAPNHTWGGTELNSDGDKTIDDANVYIIATINTETQELIVTFKSDIAEDVLSALTLKINDELQSVEFKAGENRITLKKPYEYNNASNPYDYIIDINYYEISYFSPDASLSAIAE